MFEQTTINNGDDNSKKSQDRWSIQAELTISHTGLNNSEVVNSSAPQTRTEFDANAVRMTYKFLQKSDPNKEPSDSGYGSNDIISQKLSNLQQKKQEPISMQNVSSLNNGKCRHFEAYSRCWERHQLSTLKEEYRDRIYICRDPWCQHFHYYGGGAGFEGSLFEHSTDDCDSWKSSRGTTVDDSCLGNPGFGDFLNFKDASVQTKETVDRGTSPWSSMVTARKKYSSVSSRRRTEPLICRSDTGSSLTPDSLDGPQTSGFENTIVGPGISKPFDSQIDLKDSSNSSNKLKPPRTVHIDVYCTGTELESDSSCSSVSVSTPQTVFESPNVRIMHKRATDQQFPYSSGASRVPIYGARQIQVPESGSEEDEDGNTSSGYPSKLSSLSTITDFSSSLSSVPLSWNPSNCTLLSQEAVDDEPSVLKSPKFAKTFDLSNTNNSKFHVQQQKMTEYFQKRLDLVKKNQMAQAFENDSDSDSEDDDQFDQDFESHGMTFRQLTNNRNLPNKSPSTVAFEAKLRQNPDLRAPFTIVPGVFTSQRAVAKRFGPVVNAMKKPGHHIGPAKNPDCVCDHCRYYYENCNGCSGVAKRTFRARTRSVGDPPNFQLIRRKV